MTIPDEEAVKLLSVAEIEAIILQTEPGLPASVNGDKIWTRRMAKGLHDALSALSPTTPDTQAPGSGETVPAGWRLVPEDLLTHIGDWQAACEIARHHAAPATVDIDDKSYWDHQLRTIAKVRAMLASAPSASIGSEDEYWPKVIHYDREGDPHWQFVERDVPTVTGRVFAANVEMLKDFDGNIVGFTIYEPSASIGAMGAGWQGIASAPKDGLVLLACVGWPAAAAKKALWPVKVGGWWAGGWNIFGASWEPTHWMPLPPAPTLPAETQAGDNEEMKITEGLTENGSGA